VPFNVDTTPPAVTSITLSQPSGYVAQGAPLTATVVCTDPTSHAVFSGIGQCGSQGSPQAFVGNQQTVTTTAISLSTSTLGTNTFTAIAKDVAGNSSPTASVTYQVVGTDNLAVLMLGNLVVKTGGTITYDIIVANGGPNASSLTKVTDSLPAGTSFVSAGYAIDSVTVSGGQITKWSITPPTMSCGNSPGSWQGSCSIGNLPAWTGKNPVAAVVQITVKVTAGAGTTIKNNAAVSSVNSNSDVKYNTSAWATLVTK